MAIIAPYVFLQELDSNGAPLAGGKVYTYEAGTSTPKQTFTDSTEATTNANPIILDASGRADIWLDTGSYKFVLRDADDNLIKTVDNITGSSDTVFGNAVDNISTNYTVVAGDAGAIKNATASLTVSLLDSSTAGEGFIIGVKNSSSGNVTIDPDGLELIDGLSTITIYPDQSALIVCTGTGWLSLYQDLIAAGENNTFTGDNTFSGDTTFSGDIVMSSSQIQEVKGADIASASALPLLTDGNFFDVTGTTTITSIDTSGTVGTEITLQFDGILTLTHNATDLILPTGANITTSAGDVATFREYASGDWVCINYQRADGKPLSNITLGTSQATTSGTAFDFSIPSGVKKVSIFFSKTSLSGTDDYIIQLSGTSLETSGYTSQSLQIDGSPNGVSSTAGFIIINADATSITEGVYELFLYNTSNKWVGTGVFNRTDDINVAVQSSGSKTITGELSQVRITRTGTNTFDAGEINVQYEF